MTIRIFGVLPDPFGAPCPKATIRFTALTTEGSVFKGTDAEAITDKQGNYDFPLEEGRYLLEIKYSDELMESGSVLVDEFTPSHISLLQLIQYATPYTPPLVDTAPTEWATLFQEVIDNDEWDRQSEQQVRNEDVLVNEDKTIHKDEGSYLTKETLTNSTGSNQTVQQSLSYKDATGREAGYNKQTITTDLVSTGSGEEAYSDVDSYEAKQFSLLEGAESASKQERTITDTNVLDSKESSVGSNTASTNATVTGSGAEILENVTTPTAQVTSRKYVDANDLVSALLEQGVIVENVEAFDRLTVSSAGSKREIQVDEFNVGNTFKVDTQNDVVTVEGQLRLTNGDDYKGPVGDSQYLEYAYATTEGKDTNDWHIDNPDDPYDLPEGTVWRKHRTVFVKSGETTYGLWSNPYLLTGEDGAEGDTLYWNYKYSSTDELADPAATNPVGWEDVLKDGHLYRIERLVSNNSYQGLWSAPAKIAGTDGDNGELVFEEYMYSPYGVTTPETDPQQWHTNFSNGDYFRSSRVIKYAAGTPIPIPDGTEPVMVTGWTTPALISPRKGYEYADGLSQIVVHLYIRSTLAPALPTDVLTYDFNTLTLSGNTNGWDTEIPTGTGNLWLTVATASSNTGSDDIAPNEWADPQISATQAYNQATLSLYKRSAVGVIPEAPSTTLTYDFAIGALTGDLEGWVLGTIPAGTDDLYIASATVRSQTTTSDVLPSQWGVGILTSTAFRQQTVNIYRRGSDTRPNSDVEYNFTDGSVTGLSDWSLSIPEGTEDVFIGVAVASAAGVSDVIHPEDWSIGPLGSSGHQAVVLNLYRTGSEKPQEPQVEITYDFVQGKITSDTGEWKQAVPANTDGKIYVTTATANASALADTDVIPVGEWTDPQVILESGINAVPVTLYRKYALENVPPKHTNNLTYSFTNAALITTPNNSWQPYPMDVELGEGIWSVTATANGLASDPTDVIEPDEFTDPVLYSATGSIIFEVFQYSETSTGPWFDEVTPTRVWRKQATSVNGIVGDWSEPMKLTGEDGAAGDTLYVVYQYSSDLSNWHDGMQDGDIWRKEAIVNNGVFGDWSSPARIKGDAESIEYQYAAVLDDESAWHSNFSTGDYYRRERYVFNGQAGTWSEPAQIVPLKDVDYSDGASGDTIYEVYQYSVDGVSDWVYDFTDEHIYRRTAVVMNGALGPWSEPAKLSGIDGADGDTIYMEYEYSVDGMSWHFPMEDGDIWRHEREHTVGVTVPTDPWGNRTRIRGIDGAYYEYLYNDDADNYPTEPDDAYGTWHANFSEGDYYRIERLVQESGAGNWTTPTKLKPKKGEDYNDGIQGPKGDDGAITYTWIKYADDVTGSGMDDSPAGKPYMGIAYNKLTEEESTDPSEYQWSKVEGDQGIQGENGFMWIQYSNHDDGMSGTMPAMSQEAIDPATGRPYMYIGIAYNKQSQEEGSDPTEYTWSKYIGDEIYYEYSYSPDKVDWDETIDANDIWRRERRVENGFYGDWSEAIRIVGQEGPQGVEGEKGDTGATLYTWIRYADDASGNGISNNPTGKKYIGMAYNKATATESNNKSDYLWSLVQGADGKDGLNGADGVDGLDGEQGIQGPRGESGLTSYFHTAYADSDTGEGFSQSPVGKDYIGTYSDFSPNDSTNPAKYTWVLVKGAQGADGTDGIAGENGENGETSYLHIAYAETAEGGYMSQDPTGKDYIGQYVDFEIKDSTNPNDYTWALIKGADGRDGIDGADGIDGLDGADGIQGEKGEDGSSSYFHIAYADDGQGNGFSQSPAGKPYMGTYSDSEPEDSSNPNDYLWIKVEGSQGATGNQGIPGKDGTNGQTSYLHIAYADNENGDGFSQQPDSKDYIGQYVDFTSTDSDNPSRYTWAKIKGEQGNQGVEGPIGPNGNPTYTWIKYSSNADGSNMTDVPKDNTKYLGISPNHTEIHESDDPSEYTWSAYTGSNGQYYEDEFSITGDPKDEEAWHYPAYSQDKFKRTRLIDSEGNAVVDGTTDTYGWVYTQMTPIKDVDYGDGNSGDTIFEVYQYSTDGTENWEDEFRDEHNFRRTAVVINGSQSEWSAAARITGQNGLQSNLLTLFQIKPEGYSWTEPELIQDNLTYLVLTGTYREYSVVEGINGWKIGVPADVTAGMALFQISCAVLSEAGELEVPVEADVWSEPVQVTASGVAGEQGKHGSGSYIVEWVDTYNSGQGFNDLITDILEPLGEGDVEYWFREISGRVSQAGDMLTIQQSAVPDTLPKSWLRNGSKWETFVLVVDGNAVIDGTLSAQALKTETAITDILYIASNASRTELTLSGSGGWNDGAGNVVAATDYRLWIGHAKPNDAPFRVDKYGNTYLSKLTAENAVVKGHIEASSGTFHGRVEAESGYFKGAVYASEGTFTGDVYANAGWFKGTVYADKISGDVVSALVLSASDKSGSGWATFDTVKVNGASSKSRRLVCTVTLRASASRSGSSTGSTYASARARLTGSFGTVYSQILETPRDHRSSGNGAAVKVVAQTEVTLIVTVPANATGSMSIQVNLEGGEGTPTAAIKGTSGNNWVAQLMPNGSDLGA